METNMNAIIPLADSTNMRGASRHPRQCAGTIDNDVIKGRRFDVAKKYLPDGLFALFGNWRFPRPKCALPARSRAAPMQNVFGLVERFITAKL